MFGPGGNPFEGQQQEQFGGPLAGLDDQVVSVLNAADQRHVYIPGNQFGPVITLPRPQAGYQAAGYRPAAPPYTGQHRSGERLTGPSGLIVVIILLVLALVTVTLIALA
jgi:hypothetical protein